MDKIKVSILVPAYHVEAYLDECLQSLLSQTLKEIEIVVVDDGSSDRTATIAEQYAASDSRIRVIRLPEHQGVSHARNACLVEAQGEYLSFVDSDDTVSSTAMEELYHRAKTTDADIVLGSMLYCYPDGRQARVGDKSPVFRSDNEILSGQECFIRMQQTGCYVPMVCSNLYRTAFIKTHPQLHFEGEFHEDEYFTPFALYEATRVTDFKKDFYLYRQRPDSIMHKSDNINLRIEALKRIINYQKAFADQLPQNGFKEAMWQNISRLHRSAGKLQESLSKNRVMKHTILYISPHTPEQEVRKRLKEALATDNAERFCILQENDCPIRNEWQRQIFFHEHRQEEYICTETGRMVLTRKCMEYILNRSLPLDGKKLVAELKGTSFAPFVKEECLCIHLEEDIHWWKIATSRNALFANLPDKESSQGLKERIERYWMQSVPLTIDSSGCWYSPTLVGHWFDEGLAKGISTLFHYMDVREVGDFGCGPGWYVAYWRKQGYEADGYDGNPYTEELSATFFDDGYYCQCADLTEELEADGMFDAIVSLEVGEHIPQDRESTFIRNLTRNARNHIILSWAVEGQEGDGHVNCHSNKFVISRMRQYGFVLNRPATRYLRECACLPWFKQTLLCFDRLEFIPSPRQPEVSVIVPGYNAATYLEECLDSIHRQSLYPIEVIMVNDGSTDGTKQIMERYCKNDIRFRYFGQENQGLSEARNTGMRHADGQYIMFVDADDRLPEDALMNLCEKARRTDADMVAGNVALYYDGKTKDYTMKHPDSKENCTGEDFLCQVVRHGSFTTMVYGYLYRRSFIEQHGLRFEPGILHEDELWTPIALTKAKRVASIGSTTYLYRQHEASIMSSSKAERRIASIGVVIRRLEEFMECNVMNYGCREAIKDRIKILGRIASSI